MKITEAIAVEHAAFASVFDQVERVLHRLKSAAEVSVMANVLEGFLATHAQMETGLAFVALDHALLQKDQFETMHQQHQEMDDRLHQVHRAATCTQARRLLRAAMRASVRHFRDEERDVFPALERALKPEDLAALSKAFRRTPRVKAKPLKERGLTI